MHVAEPCASLLSECDQLYNFEENVAGGSNAPCPWCPIPSESETSDPTYSWDYILLNSSMGLVRVICCCVSRVDF